MIIDKKKMMMRLGFYGETKRNKERERKEKRNKESEEGERKEVDPLELLEEGDPPFPPLLAQYDSITVVSKGKDNETSLRGSPSHSTVSSTEKKVSLMSLLMGAKPRDLTIRSAT